MSTAAPQTLPARNNLTREEREANRAMIVARHGYDPTISETIADEIRAQVSKLWHIQREEFTNFRLSFYVMPLMSSQRRQLWDMETALMKNYGSAPHKLGTRFSQYALEFFAN